MGGGWGLGGSKVKAKTAKKCLSFKMTFRIIWRVCFSVSVHACVCEFVCVCVWERELHVTGGHVCKSKRTMGVQSCTVTKYTEGVGCVCGGGWGCMCDKPAGTLPNSSAHFLTAITMHALYFLTSTSESLINIQCNILPFVPPPPTHSSPTPHSSPPPTCSWWLHLQIACRGKKKKPTDVWWVTSSPHPVFSS